MKSYTAGYVLSKHLAALKRLKDLSLDERNLQLEWEKAYKLIVPFLSEKQRQIALATSKNRFINSVIAVNEFFLPGDHNHLLCRKYYIREWIQEAISTEGINHLVIVGVGFDPLIFTLKKLPSKLTLIDHPEMLDEARLIYDMHIVNDIEIEFIELDLNDKIETQSYFHQLKKISSNRLFLTEGVLDYLNPNSAKNLIQLIDQHLQEFDSKWISTLFCLKDMPLLQAMVFKHAVKWVGESINWIYSMQDFKNNLSSRALNSCILLNHSVLVENACFNIKMNEKLMNGFHLLKC